MNQTRESAVTKRVTTVAIFFAVIDSLITVNASRIVNSCLIVYKLQALFLINLSRHHKDTDQQEVLKYKDEMLAE